MNRKCLFAALALIATGISPVATQPAQPASPMAGCKEEKARFVVGEPYSDELAERARQASGANVVRKTVPGGALTGEHGVGIEKRDLMTFQFNPEDLQQQMRVRAVFDPAWLLNSAKVFPLDGRLAA